MKPNRTEDLARKLLDGDLEQFEGLYNKISPALQTWARLQLRGPLRSVLSADDLMQEVWLRGLEKYRSFNPKRGSFRSWIFGISKFVLLEAHRALREPCAQAAMYQRGLTWIGEHSAEVTRILDRLQRNEAQASLMAALERMDVRERHLICLCGLEGISHREVGELMGMNKEAVSKAWQRLRARLAAEHPQWKYWADGRD